MSEMTVTSAGVILPTFPDKHLRAQLGAVSGLFS